MINSIYKNSYDRNLHNPVLTNKLIENFNFFLSLSLEIYHILIIKYFFYLMKEDFPADRFYPKVYRYIYSTK